MTITANSKLLILVFLSLVMLGVLTSCDSDKRPDTETCDDIPCDPPYLLNGLSFKLVNEDSIDLVFDSSVFSFEDISLREVNLSKDVLFYGNNHSNPPYISADFSLILDDFWDLRAANNYKLKLNDTLQQDLDLEFILTSFNDDQYSCDHFYLQSHSYENMIICNDCHLQDIIYIPIQNAK